MAVAPRSYEKQDKALTKADLRIDCLRVNQIQI